MTQGAQRPRPPAFVVGPGRSGTTLGINLLRREGTMFCAPMETGYFWYVDLIEQRFAGLDPATWRRQLGAFIRHTVIHGFPLRANPAWEPAADDVSPAV